MFVDASALMAILKGEVGSQVLSQTLEQSADPITSPVAIVETVMSLAKQKQVPASKAYADLAELLMDAAITTLAIDTTTAEFALEAHSKYGKGSGHPAQLNLGDCFAYAMAKQHRVPLLYKGDDFAKTDLA